MSRCLLSWKLEESRVWRWIGGRGELGGIVERGRVGRVGRVVVEVVKLVRVGGVGI